MKIPWWTAYKQRLIDESVRAGIASERLRITRELEVFHANVKRSIESASWGDKVLCQAQLITFELVQAVVACKPFGQLPATGVDFFEFETEHGKLKGGIWDNPDSTFSTEGFVFPDKPATTDDGPRPLVACNFCKAGQHYRPRVGNLPCECMCHNKFIV